MAGSFGEQIDFGTTSLTSVGKLDSFLANNSASGSLLWVRQGGGSSSTEAFGLAVDGAGNCVVTGTFEDEATFASIGLKAKGMKDVFLVKDDTSGNVKWARGCGGPNHDLVNAAALDSSGNAYLAGSFVEQAVFGDQAISSTAAKAVFVAKDDRDGTAQWAATAGHTDFQSDAYSVAVSPDGSIYVAGGFDTDFDADDWKLHSQGGSDAFLWKLNNSGTSRVRRAPAVMAMTWQLAWPSTPPAPGR